LAVFSLPTAGYFLIRQEKVQAYLVQKITTKLSDFFGAPVTISGATMDLFSTITLHDFCVRTPQKDTILYTSELDLQINNLAVSSKYFEFDKITMKHPDINFYIDSVRNINFLFIVKKLTSKDTTASAHPLTALVHEIELKDADFTLKSYNMVKRDTGINFTDLHLKSLNIRVTNCRIDHGISFKIKEFSAIDKSGFVLNQCSGRVKIDKNHMVYNNMRIQTDHSDVHINQVLFDFNNFKDFKPGIFEKKVKMNIELKSSVVSTDDVAWFVPSLRNYHIKAEVAGTVYGRINDLKFRNIDVSYGTHTHLKGNMDINGLPNIKAAFLHIDIKNLYTTPAEIESFHFPKSKSGKIILPEQFKQLTFLSYHGKFTGFINDFVAYGIFKTNLGNIESDLSLRPDSLHFLHFQGQIKTNQFDFGKFMNKSDLFGIISMNAMVNGRMFGNKNIEAKLDGIVQSFVINNYNYKNIKINGTISNDTYDGAIAISDPNINCDFMGKVDLSHQIPVFNFKANVKNANLYRLNFDKKDTVSSASFYITADFEGNNIDNLNGEIRLWNSTFRKTGKEIQISNFLLFTKTVNDTSHIILSSDLADADVWGTYHFKELVNSFKNLTYHYLPSLSKIEPENNVDNNNFKFEINFKDTRQLTDFFIPELYISKDSKLSGNYNPSKNNLNFLMSIPLLQHKTKKWYDVYFNGVTSHGNFSLISGCNNLKISKQINLKNFSVTSDFKHDSIGVRVRWNNFDSIENKGDLNFLASLKSLPGHSRPLLRFALQPSKLVLKDSMWQLNSGVVELDSSEVRIEHFSCYSFSQAINVHGSISRHPERPLTFDIQNMNLANLDSLLAPKKLKLQGVIRGKAELFDLYNNPIFKASLDLDSLSVNNESLGKTAVNAVYNNADKNIAIEVHASRGAIKTLDISGTYATLSKALDFKIELNKLKINAFEPFVATIFSDLRGIASGLLTLTGTTLEPLLNGTIKAQKVSFVVNYLKARYNFTHNVEIKNNTFLFNKIEVFDNAESNRNFESKREGKAIVNGQIEYRNLKDLYIDVQIDAINLLSLNTVEKDNVMFFGQGFASGTAYITGTQRSVNMDIHAKTNSNTIISIPLGIKAELTESNYIKFVNKQKPIVTNQYEIDKPIDNKRIETRSSIFRMNFVLEVTPDAEAQIVFDPKIGDVIKGTGSGILTMTVEGGSFNMYGTYTIEQGQYLFTMQNIINRKFAIKQGSTLSWNGNPLDANVNIDAAYPLKASIYPLLPINEEYKKPVWVECLIHLTDKLMTPNIKFDIALPNATVETQNLLKGALGSDEEMSNQVIALLFGGFFIPTNNATTSATGYSAAGSNGLEFLSNQLSRMLSQISKDFDIGFNYRPGDLVTTEQVAMALSTQLWGGEVIVNVNADFGGRPVNSTTSNIVGEGSVEFKITDNGKLRAKAFNRSNETYGNTNDISPYTQGVGVLYKENFNTFGELLRRYYKMLFTRKENKDKPVEEDNQNDSNSENE